MTLTDELKQTFLFEGLTAEQLQELADAGSVVHLEARETLLREGEPADYLWVLLQGMLELSRHVGGRKMVLMTTDRQGIYAGGFRAYGEGAGSAYRATIRVLEPSRVFRLPSSELADFLRKWFPMGKHLLDGLLQTVASIDSMVRERESLVALGTMAAGLAHELNNPAAAAVRATDHLRTTLDAMSAGMRDLIGSEPSPDQVDAIYTLQAHAVTGARGGRELSPLAASELEDEVGYWLLDHGMDDGWQLAPNLVAAGLDTAWLERAAQQITPGSLAPGLRWINNSIAALDLLDDLNQATKRISGLVQAVKEYTYMDRAPVQEIDLHEGLENTLIMLGHKLKKGIDVFREYDPTLPRIEAYGSELNQVWLNLLDNAVDAADSGGEIRIRTACDDAGARVEIADNGPGIPEEIRRRIFEPFFTTKEPGKGTGLGLDIARRIVVERHGGDLVLDTAPGTTRFVVRLPLHLQDRGE